MIDLSKNFKLLKKVDKTNIPSTFVSDENSDRINVSYYFSDKTVIMKGELVSNNEEITFAESKGIFVIVDFTKFKGNIEMMDVISKIN